jgi:O-antigen/teichoic acid export membrane protein
MGLRRLVLALVVVGAAGTAGAFVVGPTIVRVLFGPAYALGSRDFATLAGGTIAYMVALAYAQGLIALRGHRLVAAAWLSGLGAFAVVTTLGSELISRVGNGFFAGSVTAAVVMALLVQVRLRSSRAPGTERVEQLPEVPFVP